MDLTIAFDDLLVERPQACVCCRRRATWADIRVIHERAWCMALCARCHSTYGWAAVDQLLAARYGGLQGTTQARED
jgi:hypothetical protein